MRVNNRDDLVKTPAREVALDLVEAGLGAIDTGIAIKRAVTLDKGELKIDGRPVPLESTGRLLVVAIGKCALDAAMALEDILGDRISDGVAIDVRNDPSRTLERIRCLVGDHPYPTERNVNAAGEIIKLLEDARGADVIITVVSGGGSTLLCQPQNSTCQDERLLVEALFKAGATIQELNTIRKHLSLARGGYLARYAYPARLFGLIFSDVPGDNFEFIASGPTVLDPSTVEDALVVCKHYRLARETGFDASHLIETPKDQKYFAGVNNILLTSNRVALEAMAAKTTSLGYKVEIKNSQLTGEAGTVATNLINELHLATSKTIYLYGGETTVNVRGTGRGGRNQELVLNALPSIADDELVLAFASDGWDNSDVAGALGDLLIKRQAVEKDLALKDFLVDNNSYDFFDAAGGHLKTGRTGSNVSDLIITLKN
ncbi:MAG: DUF4147 domain-containing protein [Patescibacteria group bacterium]|nr:DUF4147 domain-containing protein [Patescibacteria group bacterium]